MEVKFKTEKPQTKDTTDRSKRGTVKHFSTRSRRRLLNQILKLENRDGYYFVTLTYPKEYSLEFTEWKTQLRKLYCTLQYHYPRMGFLWKLEYQKRGAPHFHLLMFEPSRPDRREIWSLIRDCWYRIVGVKSKSFRHHSVSVKAIRNIKTSGFYLAMYQCKDSQERLDIPSGRTWGIYGRKQMPTTAFGCEQLDEHQYKLLKRTVRKWVQKQKYSKSYAKYLTSRIGSFQIFIPIQEQVRLMAWIRRVPYPLGA